MRPFHSGRSVARSLERAPTAQLVFHPLGDGFDDERALTNGELAVVLDNRPASQSRFLQGGIVIGVDIVETDNVMPRLQQALRQVKANETSGTSDQDFLL